MDGGVIATAHLIVVVELQIGDTEIPVVIAGLAGRVGSGSHTDLVLAFEIHALRTAACGGLLPFTSSRYLSLVCPGIKPKDWRRETAVEIAAGRSVDSLSLAPASADFAAAAVRGGRFNRNRKHRRRNSNT